MPPTTFIFAALSCEAKPIIQSRQLKPIPGKHPFSVYANADCLLVVSGIGKVAMAGAVGYALALFPQAEHPLLLNLGIAGSRDESLGSLFLADKILDQDSGKTFYPPLVFNAVCKTKMVITVAAPQQTYTADCLYDMEAAAFYEIAGKFSSAELIHSLKIVSDNASSPLANINPQRVETWVTENLRPISLLLTQLQALRQCLPVADDSLYQELMAQTHFSVSNTVILKGLLQRWQLLQPECRPDWQDVNMNNGKDIIARLQHLLDKAAFYL